MLFICMFNHAFIPKTPKALFVMLLNIGVLVFSLNSLRNVNAVFQCDFPCQTIVGMLCCKTSNRLCVVIAAFKPCISSAQSAMIQNTHSTRQLHFLFSSLAQFRLKIYEAINNSFSGG